MIASVVISMTRRKPCKEIAGTRRVYPGLQHYGTFIEDVPVRVQPAPNVLPPPPGVILLKPRFERIPGKEPPRRSEEDMLPIQEAHPELDACPPGYREVRQYRWRFCNPENNLQILPAPMTPPIAGIPYEEAEAIFKRHQAEIMALPGVSSGGLGADGIHIETDHPELVPDHFEGLPVKTGPVQHWIQVNHTLTTTTTPFHGATGLKNAAEPTSVPRFQRVALVQGRVSDLPQLCKEVRPRFVTHASTARIPLESGHEEQASREIRQV